MPRFQAFPNFAKYKKLLKLLMLFLKILHYIGYLSKYGGIRNFTSDAQFSIISDIDS